MTDSVDMVQYQQESDQGFAELVDKLTKQIEAGEHVELQAWP